MPEHMDRKTLRALSIETRQEIVRLLSKRPYTASELAKKLGKHVTTVGEHLSVLEDAGLIQKNPNGHKWIYFTLAAKGEKIFKPQLYSWVVVLSLSLILVFFGMFQIGSISMGKSADVQMYESNRLVSGAPVASADSMITSGVCTVSAEITLAVILLVVGLFGICYLVWRKYYS